MIENISLFALRCFEVCQRGDYNWKLKIYPVHDSNIVARTIGIPSESHQGGINTRQAVDINLETLL
jgi:hypothetical protein